MNHFRVLQPQETCSWFGLIRFRSPLLPESLSLSFPLGTEMFHFPKYDSLPLKAMRTVLTVQVTPLGDLRIKASLPLSVAYRSLARPSSSSGAKASTVCPYLVDYSNKI